MRGEAPAGDKIERNDGFKRSAGGSVRDVYLAHHGRTVSRRWVWLSLLLILLVVGYFVLTRIDAARSASAKAAAAAAHPGVPVSAAAVKRGDLNRYLSAIGTVTAFNTVTVKTRVDGQIVNVAFKEGQTVHQGDLLVEIDPHPYQAILDQAEGQLAKDQATLRQREDHLGARSVLISAGSDRGAGLRQPAVAGRASRPARCRATGRTSARPRSSWPIRRSRPRSPDASGCAW